MLSKKSTSKELAAQLSKVLDGMKNDGTYEKIAKKYSDKYKISQW
jgi:ABC-type amino acid transport substrate-binding protein